MCNDLNIQKYMGELILKIFFNFFTIEIEYS